MQANTHDWHPAEVKCALEKLGTNLSELSEKNGLARSTLRNVFRAPWPKGERIIADALNEKPENIWPSRYMRKTA
ncbi:helix-turn-helix transcriptional regulator [Vibrio parahaemolyticus]|uniref:helix-turn-helix domain-containing protein n=1 Tax=Vibrio TaxID=662 RepID=UPI0019D4987E|nr:helix-turn-helix transcriptional regulator [Vibrio vulnificus]MBN8112606.1 helix-turn-helix domain-containing protein [Vibrio vulnificus]